jgi:hypothetical protein
MQGGRPGVGPSPASMAGDGRAWQSVDQRATYSRRRWRRVTSSIRTRRASSGGKMRVGSRRDGGHGRPWDVFPWLGGDLPPSEVEATRVAGRGKDGDNGPIIQRCTELHNMVASESFTKLRRLYQRKMCVGHQVPGAHKRGGGPDRCQAPPPRHHSWRHLHEALCQDQRRR